MHLNRTKNYFFRFFAKNLFFDFAAKNYDWPLNAPKMIKTDRKPIFPKREKRPPRSPITATGL